MAKIITTGLGLELHGKAGNVVFAQTRNGLVMRARPALNNPRTPAQSANRARFATAAKAYQTLSGAEAALWQAYAQTITRTDPRGGAPTHPTAYHAFVGLAGKFLQVHPTGTIPTTPPTAPFFGDGITLTATADAGQITFTASGPNAATVVTELLLQPLAHGNRAPKPNLYRPQAFVGFVSGSLSHTVTVAPGWVAPAYRFVNALTGQEVGLVRLASVQA